MKPYLMITLLTLGLMKGATAQDTTRYTVFKSGTEGYNTFRIPALIRNTNGELLAFAEGRVDGSNDFGKIRIVLKRSANGGKTWTPVQVVATNHSLQAGNPAPVIDTKDPRYPNGRIFIFYNIGNGHEMEMREGKGYRQIFYKTSIDGGKSWSDSVDITSQVNLLNKPDINPDWNHPEDWRTYANTPGHGFQFEGGKYNGRIYIAANHSSGDPRPALRDYRAHGFYTDDHGETFKISAPVPFDGTNESTAAQWGKNGVIMNSRNQTGKNRVLAFSEDGGQNWKQAYVEQQLPDPINEGSMLNFGNKKQKYLLAFCNAASQKHRDSLTLRLSYNLGKTWTKGQLIGPAKPVFKESSAYSDIVKIDDKTIGVLYETDAYRRIVYIPVTVEKQGK